MIYAVGPYSGALGRAVRAFKFGDDPRWARPFASLLSSFLVTHYSWFEEFAVLCPVPSHSGDGPQWHRLEQVCLELEPLIAPEWPVERLLVKRSATSPMRPLAVRDRTGPGRSQLARALHVPRPEQVRGRRIVLLDDVVASGSTFLAAAHALRAAGAAEVAGLALARARWRAGPRMPGS